MPKTSPTRERYFKTFLKEFLANPGDKPLDRVEGFLRLLQQMDKSTGPFELLEARVKKLEDLVQSLTVAQAMRRSQG